MYHYDVIMQARIQVGGGRGLAPPGEAVAPPGIFEKKIL